MGKCKATISFGDDYQDNECTFHCQLEEGHEGPHKEEGYSMQHPTVVKFFEGKASPKFVLTWEE